jgi:uncharacterized membrane protein YhaH (DUF805 family)
LTVALSLLAVLILAATAYVLGRLLAPRLGEGWAIPMALGLAAISHLGLFLGFAGLLKPLPVLIVLASIHLLGLRVWGELPREMGELFRRIQLRGWLTGTVVLLPLTILPLYPPTAFDATLYHLPFARAFAASGGVPFLADLRFPVFPQANEVLFAQVMLFAPDIAAHGVQWLMTMLTAALVWQWGRDAFSSRAAGGLAAAAFLGNPIVVHLAGSAYIEPGLTLFATAALYAARRWREAGERSWLVLSAVFAATAADTKYLGLFFVGAVGLAVLLGRVPEREARLRVLDVLLFAAVAAAVLAPWYGRTFAYTGNPFFPFFPRLFGASAWNPLRFQILSTGVVQPTGGFLKALLSRLEALGRLPWGLVFERGKYNGQPPYSPVYLALLPLLLLAVWRDSRPRRLLALAVAYVVACFSLPADSRYLLPAAPLVSLAVAGTIVRLLGQFRRHRRFLAAGLCAGFLLPGWLYGLYRVHRQGPVPLTPAQREAYLAKRVPLYPAVAYLNRTEGSGYTAWGLHAEHMVYYARGRFLGDWIGPASFARVLAGRPSSEILYHRLRRLGADHLLVVKNQQELEFSEDASFGRWFQKVYEDSHARVYRLIEEE